MFALLILDEQYHFGSRRTLGDEQLPGTVARQTAGELGSTGRLGASTIDRENKRRPIHGVRAQRQSKQVGKNKLTKQCENANGSINIYVGIPVPM